MSSLKTQLKWYGMVAYFFFFFFSLTMRSWVRRDARNVPDNVSTCEFFWQYWPSIGAIYLSSTRYRWVVTLNDLTRVYLLVTEALVHYGSFLTEYEKKEIGSYSEIWFLGLKACKIRGEENSGYNFGFDDENGNYNKVRITRSALKRDGVKGPKDLKNLAAWKSWRNSNIRVANTCI